MKSSILNSIILCSLINLLIRSNYLVQSNEGGIGIEEEEENEHHEPVSYVVTQEAWFEFGIKDSYNSTDEPVRKGRIVIGLFGDICPMTTTNFAQLTKGFKRDSEKFSYKGSPIHRIVKDFVIQMGDFVNLDGSGSRSIYGDKFIDENFILSHRSPGWVSMANYGKDTNGSQFFITLVPARWLDGNHVVFGRVLSGMSLIREISELKTYKGSSVPKKHVLIVDCGIKDINRYELSEDQVDSPGDAKSD